MLLMLRGQLSHAERVRLLLVPREAGAFLVLFSPAFFVPPDLRHRRAPVRYRRAAGASLEAAGAELVA